MSLFINPETGEVVERPLHSTWKGLAGNIMYNGEVKWPLNMECDQCGKDLHTPAQGVAIDFMLKVNFCFECWKTCTRCGEPTGYATVALPSSTNGIYHLFCPTCYDEYQMYLDPPCPSHPLSA